VNSFSVRLLFSQLFAILFPPNGEISSSFIDALRNLVLLLLFFGCCKIRGLIISVFEKLHPIFADNEHRRIAYFFPLLRSGLLMDAELQFIPALLESGTFSSLVRIGNRDCPPEVRDQIADFLVVIIRARPAEALSEQSVAVLLRNLTFLPEYQSKLLPLFEIGMSITGDNEITKGAIMNTIEQAMIILTSCTSDDSQHKAAVVIVSYMTNFVENFGQPMLSEWVNLGLFEKVALLPNSIRTSESMLASIGFFSAVCVAFPQFIAVFNANQSSPLRGMQDALLVIQHESSVTDALLCLALNQRQFVITRESSMLQNRAALRLLLQVIRDTSDEPRILTMLCNLTEFSVLNAFECFMCDIVGYLMDRIRHNRHIDISVAFFECIGSMFFSPLAVRQIVHALWFDENGYRYPRHCILLNSFQILLLGDLPIPVFSFFHFSAETHGIIGPIVEPTCFSSPFSLATAIKQEGKSRLVGPIISFEDGPESYLSLFLHNNTLSLKRVD
jgi:hypothetical protein